MTRAAYSLRRRLIWLVVLSILGVGLVSMAAVYQRAHHEADELLDTQLAQLAETLLTLSVGGEFDRFATGIREQTRRFAVPIAFEIRRDGDAGGERLVTSPEHAGFALPIPDGYSSRIHKNKHWRLFSLHDPVSRYTVVVGQRHSARDRLARETALTMLIPFLLALPLMALLVSQVVSRAMRPVDSLTESVRALGPDELTPLDTHTPLPQEIAPLRAAFNTLLHRVSTALDSERRFTSDAAHELRTPLAALKIQAQVARRAQPGEAQAHALAQVVAGVDRMTHLVEQLLTLARVEHSQPPASAAYPAAALLDACCEPYRELAATRGQTLTLESQPDCAPALDRTRLEIVARNLIANAVNYAGPGARIAVRLHCTGERVELSVRDSGPGLSPAARTALRARFARGETDAEGCGLGLSIVERIAQRAQAHFELVDGLPNAEGGVGLGARFDCPSRPPHPTTPNPPAESAPPA